MSNATFGGRGWSARIFRGGRRLSPRFVLGLASTAVMASTVGWILLPKKPPVLDKVQAVPDAREGVPVSVVRRRMLAEEERKETTSPATQQVAPAESTTQPAAPTKDELWLRTAFDPQSPETPAEYKLPIELSTAQAQEFVQKLENLNGMAGTYFRFRQEYNDTYDEVADDRVKEALYDRVKRATGFKYADLPKRWREIEQGGKIWPDARMISDAYANQRYQSIKGDLLEGRMTAGDREFLERAFQDYYDRANELTRALYKARKLREMLVEEGILGQQRAPRPGEPDREMGKKMQEFYRQMGQYRLRGP